MSLECVVICGSLACQLTRCAKRRHQHAGRGSCLGPCPPRRWPPPSCAATPPRFQTSFVPAAAFTPALPTTPVGQACMVIEVLATRCARCHGPTLQDHRAAQMIFPPQACPRKIQDNRWESVDANPRTLKLHAAEPTNGQRPRAPRPLAMTTNPEGWLALLAP